MLENSWTNARSQELRNISPPTPSFALERISVSQLFGLAGWGQLALCARSCALPWLRSCPARWLLTQRLAPLCPGEVFDLGRGLHSFL